MTKGHQETAVYAQLPVDNVLAFVDAVTDAMFTRGLLPRPRPPAAVAKVFPAAAGAAANRALSSVPNRILGVSVRETTGAAVGSIELRDGSDPTGDLVLPVNLAAGASLTLWLGPEGIGVGTGVYLVRASGSVEGAVFLGEV